MVTSYGTGLLGKPSHDSINKLLEYEIKMLEVFCNLFVNILFYAMYCFKQTYSIFRFLDFKTFNFYCHNNRQVFVYHKILDVVCSYLCAT